MINLKNILILGILLIVVNSNSLAISNSQTSPTYNLGTINSTTTVVKSFLVHPEFNQVEEYYQFTLTKTTKVVIDHCGSSITSTSLQLLNTYGGIISESDFRFGSQCDDANYIYATLSPGFYQIRSAYFKDSNQDVAVPNDVTTRIQFLFNL